MHTSSSDARTSSSSPSKSSTPLWIMILAVCALMTYASITRTATTAAANLAVSKSTPKKVPSSRRSTTAVPSGTTMTKKSIANGGPHDKAATPPIIGDTNSMNTTTTMTTMSSSLLLPEFPVAPEFSHKVQRNRNKCPEDVDYLGFLARRARNHRLGVGDDKVYWQSSLDHKLAGTAFGKNLGIRVPRVLACGDMDQIVAAFANHTGPFVVKTSNMPKGHSSKGVWVFEHGFGGLEQVSGKKMTSERLVQVAQKRGFPSRMGFYVEEMIQGPVPDNPPFDFKFFAFNGEIATASYSALRHRHQAYCSAYVDEHFNRMDGEGCMFGSTTKKIIAPKDCPGNGAFCRMCKSYQAPKGWAEMVQAAKLLSRNMGIAMRIDFLLDADGGLVLGEFTPSHAAGYFMCASKKDPVTGAVDPCFMGKLWKEGNRLDPHGMEGGPIPPEPEYLKGWFDFSPEEQCLAAMDDNPIIQQVDMGQGKEETNLLLDKELGSQAVKSDE